MADRNKEEVMDIVLRYVLVDDAGKCRIHESPVLVLDVFQEIEDMLAEKFGSTDVELRSTGVNVGQVLLKKINELGLDKNTLVGQGYDGAAYMSSEAVGAAAEVRNEAPLAMYFHCAMHMLNLCSSETCCVTAVRNCVDTVGQMTSFFNNSPKRCGQLEKDIQSATENASGNRTRLVTLCKTRFIERHEAIITAVQLLPHVVRSLETMLQWSQKDTRIAARSLLASVKDFDFIIALHALAKVAGCLRQLSIAIQQVGLDVLKAVSDVLDVIGLLQKYRNDSECFIALFQSAVETAKLLEITVKKPRTVKRSVYRDNSGGNDQSVEEYYRLNLFFPLIDSICSHLQDRFGPVQQKLFGLSALVPAHLGSYNDVVDVVSVS